MQSRLGDARIARGVTQAELAAAVGVSVRTIEKLESHQVRNPGIRLINNCALALNVKLESLIEPWWRGWLDFDEKHPAPPDAETFLNKRRLTHSLRVERRMLGLE